MKIVNNRLCIEQADGRLTVRNDQTHLTISNANGAPLVCCPLVEAVVADERAHVEIIGNVLGIATKDSVMWAFSGARVWALGGRTYARAGAHVVAEAGSEVHALDGSTVIGRPSAHVIAYYGCVAKVSWQTSVMAYLHARVIVTDLHTMPAGENVNAGTKLGPDHLLVEGSLLI